MKWIITKDLLENKPMQHRNFKDITDVLINPTKFRLLDDDGIIYFKGLTEDSSSFQPLDAYGVAFGCTSIEYLEKGVWTVL